MTKRLFFIFLLFCSVCSFAETITGKVVKVIDGDTFDVLQDNNTTTRIRLYGIDAPEIKGGQPYWRKSKEFLAGMIAGQKVTVTVKSCDRYGRTLGVVSTSTIQDVNLEMIKAGMAWHYSYYDNIPSYRDAQDEARNARRGLWFAPDPINPYEWRKGTR